MLFVWTVSVDDAEPPAVSVKLVGLRDAVGPVGDTEAVSDTLPAKVPRLVVVTVDVAEELDPMLRYDGLLVREAPEILMLAMKVDQQFPPKQSPVVML